MSELENLQKELEILQLGSDVILRELGKRGIVLKGATPPNQGAGVVAPLNATFEVVVDNEIVSTWKKTGLGDTEWSPASGGGGGGAAITGTWDVTPTYTPASYSDPEFVNAFGVTELNNVITTDVSTLSPGVEGEYQYVGIFMDTEIDLLNDTSSSRRVRLIIPDTALDDQRIVVIGFVESALATPGLLQDWLTGQINPLTTYAGAFTFSNQGGNLESESVLFSDGQINTTTNTLGALTTSNTVDIYISRFEGTVMSSPGNYFIFTGALHNETPVIASESELNMVSPLTKTLTPFVSVGFKTELGVVLGGDISVEVDFDNAPVTLTPAQLGAPITQEVVDSLLGAPVATIGVENPEYTQQVNTLPVGAEVDKLYRAVVDPAYTAVHGVGSVKPFDEFVRDGELIRIADITVGNEAIDVFNEWRNDGALTDTTINPVRPLNVVYTIDELGDAQKPFVETIIDAIEYRVTPDVSPFNPYYHNNLFLLDRVFNIADNTKRLELKASLKNDTIDAVTATHAINVYHGSLNAVTMGSSIIYLDPTDYGTTGFSFSDPATQPGRTRIFGGVFDDNTAILGVYYKVTTDAPITGSLGDNISYPYISGTANTTIAYNDTGTNTVYLRVLSVANGGTNIPVVGSWNTGFETVNIITVDYMAVLDKPAIGDVTSGNNVTYGISRNFSCSYAVSSLEGVITPVNEIITQTQYNEIKSEEITATGVLLQVIQSVGAPFNDQQASSGRPPFQPDTIAVTFAKYSDGIITSYVQCYIFPELVGIGNAYSIKPDTSVAYEFDQNDLIIRYINTNDDEVEISVTNDLQTLGNFTNAVRFVNSITPNSVFTISSAGTLPLEPSDVDVRLAWYPAYAHAGIAGINEITHIDYIRGDHFNVTGTNEITMVGGLPSTPGYFQLMYDKTGSGLFYIETTVSETKTATQMLSHMTDNTSYVAVSTQTADVQLLLGNFERPDPLGIQQFTVNVEYLSPTDGYLYTVNEDFDPTLGNEMVHQMNNALARVIKTGTFNGRYFTKDNYAMWDGLKTIPYPALPAPTTNLPKPVTVILTVVDVDNVTRFSRLHKALDKIVQEGGEGTVLIDGTHSVNYAAFYDLNNFQNNKGIRLVGLNKTNNLPTDKLLFILDNVPEATVGVLKSFFTNFTPYLENIRIATYKAVSNAGSSAFRFTNAGTWEIGDNVVFEDNENYQGIPATGALNFEHTGSFLLRGGRNLYFIRSEFSSYSTVINLSAGSPDVVIEAEGLNFNQSSGGDPVQLSVGTLLFRDRTRTPDYNTTSEAYFASADYVVGFANPDVYDGERNETLYGFSPFKAKPNSVVSIKQTVAGVFGVQLPVTGVSVGDRVTVMDSDGKFGTYPFNAYVDVGGTLISYTPVDIPYAKIVFTYIGDSQWIWSIAGKPLNIIITSDATITSAWEGNNIIVDSSSTVTITIPEDATENLRAGLGCRFKRKGTGNVRFITEGTDVIQSTLGAGIPRITSQYAWADYVKDSTGVHSLFGTLELEP